MPKTECHKNSTRRNDGDLLGEQIRNFNNYGIFYNNTRFLQLEFGTNNELNPNLKCFYWNSNFCTRN